MWQSLKREFRERFATMETLGSLLILPISLLGIYLTIYYFQHAVELFLIMYYVKNVGLSLYGIFVNRIKQKIKIKELIEERIDVCSK